MTVVARRQDRLQELATQIEAETPARITVLVADLATSAGLAVVEAAVTADNRLELLVNNAGFGGYKPFVDLDPDQAEEQIRLHVVAVTRLTRAALPGLVARGRGAIINVSSRLAFSGSLAAPQLPKRATYAATKAYINTFSQILANELAGTGVQVQALCPGIVETEFHGQIGPEGRRWPASIMMSPDDVVTASLAGVRLGEVICVPALEDPSLLRAIDESNSLMLERSGGGQPATRYK